MNVRYDNITLEEGEIYKIDVIARDTNLIPDLDEGSFLNLRLKKIEFNPSPAYITDSDEWDYEYELNHGRAHNILFYFEKLSAACDEIRLPLSWIREIRESKKTPSQ